MNHQIVYQCYYAFAHRGFSVLRFNFRGVGRSAGEWDDGRGECDDFRAAIDFMQVQYPGKELWAAGFSFGAYVALTTGARDDRICTVIGIAPPVNRYDFAPVKQSAKPKFIIHGEADELIPLKQVREFYAQLADPKELVEIDRANHLFDGQVGEVADALEDLLADFSCKTQ
jgi:alpha/beta superfamily hydrolase